MVPRAGRTDDERRWWVQFFFSFFFFQHTFFFFKDQFQVYREINRKDREFSNTIPFTRPLAPVPLLTSYMAVITFLTSDEPTLTHDSIKSGLQVLTHVQLSIQLDSITWNSFTALKFCAPPIYPSLSRNPCRSLMFHSLRSSAFSRRSYR